MEKHRNLPEGNVGTVVPEGEVIGLLDELARLVKELTPHLDHILSDAVMAHQRHVLRDHAGKARIFDLSNDIYQFNQRMNALCSEAARKFATGKHGINSKRP
jgi:hypothetical protein